MSSQLNFLNSLNPADTTGVQSHPPSGGTQRTYFLPLDVMASSLSSSATTGTLKIKGQSKSTDSNGKAYPLGFTPDVDFYVNPSNINTNTGSPVERGNILDAGIQSTGGGNTTYGIPRDTNDILDQDVINAFDAFNDDSTYVFLHTLDRGEVPTTVPLTTETDIYLTSYVETNSDNEDPVSFGYDLIIDYDNSPLFNGAVEDFIGQFGNYTEVASRSNIITEFKQQFFEFFKVNIPNSINVGQPRTYYLQKISGLDGLTETISSDKSKQFVDYGKDFITLTLYEDISVNTGYLAALYKILSWSRINGKKMIPDNLLRFDIDIVVTERRRFNRVIKNNDGTMNQYADLTSRYIYSLYECQFFFERFSHGNDIDMTDTKTMDNFDIKFNYKYSNMRFEKFSSSNSASASNISMNYTAVDNSQTNLNEIDSSNSNSFSINSDGSLSLNPVTYVLNEYAPFSETTTYNPILLPANAVQTVNPLSSLNKTTNNVYQSRLNNLNISTNIQSVTNQATLLQTTLQNIETTFNSDVNMLIYDIQQDLLSFIPGNLLGGFTDDGYEYNIPAYLINKTFNATNNTLQSAFTTVIQDIYGNSTSIDGSYVSSDGTPYTPAHTMGTPLSIYNYEPIYDDTPPHDTGAPLSIYTYEPVYPDTPPHDSGATLDIYAYEPVYADTPPHDSGATLDIYTYEPVYPDTPPHDTGAALDIYTYEPVYPDTPPHDTGAALDIYTYEPVYPDTPPHDTGAPLSIYTNEPVYPDTPPHDTGAALDIYTYEPVYPDTPPHDTGAPLSIYTNEPVYADTPPHDTGAPLSIYTNEPVYADTPPHDTGAPLSIYTNEPVYPDTPPHNNTGTSVRSIYTNTEKVTPVTPTTKKSIYATDEPTKNIKGGENSLNIYGK